MPAEELPRDLATPAGTTRALREFGLRPRKRWGQHFLVSRRALDIILEAADLSARDTVLEVGAGLGTLTVALAERAGRVLAIEVDRGLGPALRKTVGGYPNVTLIFDDVMTLDLPQVFAGTPTPRKVVANLPYNVASPLIVSLLEQPLRIDRMVLTVQREVAGRLVASPGSKAYGALTIVVQYRTLVSAVGRIPASGFYPAPDVDSTILRMDVRPAPAVDVGDERVFFRVVRSAFAQRRKMLRNALAGGLPITPEQAEAACRTARIDPRRRGETLTIEEFAALTTALAAVQSSPV